ncbi:hypothetical protein FF80_01304 [Devosia sp. LC5]|uniref:hypothetical protein n=1 Tax=Devosia sp. LC5 TaxID=1502724 RepID=UPI0004E36AF6|nr:hypothetical protein [Devosia sp. LC5]KFC69498.1 hypothetical protein FF80_01304 [Devosia sp. LC5]
MVIRYDKRVQDKDLWQVYEISTGRVIVIAGHPYDGMAQHEAAEIVSLLESGALSADEFPETPLPTDSTPRHASPAAAAPDRIPPGKS